MMKNFLDSDEDQAGPQPSSASSRPARKEVIGLFDDDAYQPDSADEPFILLRVQPESIAETARKSGLAWSMGVVFFSSVAFMLVLGWGADLLFGSSPWGVVIGVVLGAVIGFIQLFRLSSQIFRK